MSAAAALPPQVAPAATLEGDGGSRRARPSCDARGRWWSAGRRALLRRVACGDRVDQLAARCSRHWGMGEIVSPKTLWRILSGRTRLPEYDLIAALRDEAGIDPDDWLRG